MEQNFFETLQLSKEVLKALGDMGFEEPTPIQAKAIPEILSGRDVIGLAQTGTGKTCAFGIPAIENLDPAADGVQVLILCPTRELAIQMAEELGNVSKYKKNVKILPIYGGQSIDRQIFALKKHPQIVIGTPGRIMDHMRRRTLKLSNLKMMILDEADEMLNMGFREDIDVILQDIPQQRQTLLFSATMAAEILELTSSYQTEPVTVKTVHKELTIPRINQYYIEVREAYKLELLCRLIDANNVKLGLVFCNTKKRVDELTEHLQTRGYSAEALHGDMKQTERDRVMNKFRKGTIDILVATDVAARGIDVNDIEVVFNYDIPNDEEYYVHRIGRTGRAGKSGAAYSFIFGREIYKLKDIMRYTKSEIHPMKPPTVADVESVKLQAAADKVKEELLSGKHKKYRAVIEKLLEDMQPDEEAGELPFVTSLDVASALFHLAFEEIDMRSYEEADFDLTTNYHPSKDSVRLFVNVGSMDRIQPSNLVQGIASRTSMPGKMIGSIEIHKNFSFVDVPQQYLEEVINIRGFSFKGKKVLFEKASKRQRPNPGQRSRSGPPSRDGRGNRGRY